MFPKRLAFITRERKSEIMEMLAYYGIKSLSGYLLTESGTEKIRAYSGSLSAEQLHEINQEVSIELIGLYLLHYYPTNIRLSFDAVNALKKEITQNILELDDKQAEEFLKGRDVALNEEEKKALEIKGDTCGFKILKHKNDFIGTGKLTQEGRIVNYMPKERRLR